VNIDHDTKAQRFTTDVDGHRAVLDYSLSDQVMTITHTGVPPAISSRGIAAELMRAALSAARAAGWAAAPRRPPPRPPPPPPRPAGR
jgi:predicted GNAT family acetyltransferase